MYALIPVVLLAACSVSPVDPPDDGDPPSSPASPPESRTVSLLIVEPAFVRFEKQRLDDPVQARDVLARSVGTDGSGVIGASVTGPFTVTTIAGGFRVSFVPETLGAFDGLLTISTDDGDREVELWGVALDEIPTIPLSAPGILDVDGADYVLETDLTCDGTCFSVQAPNITLDLNGHTIVYAESPSTSPHHGVISGASWAGVEDNPLGGNDAGLAIRNGTIRQGAGGGERSHAIAFYQMNSTGHYDISNLEIEVSGNSAVNIWVADSALRGNFDVHDNTLISNVTVIGNRHQIDGTLVRIARPGEYGPDLVHDNVLIGGAQGGIIVRAAGSQVYRNDISQNGRYSNDFSVYAYGERVEVFENTIHPVSGRGVHVNSPSCVVYDNDIDVTELPQNDEYGGCQLGGAYGVQLEDGARDVLVYANTIRARALECDAKAVRATNLTTGANNLVVENELIAERVGATSARADGISVVIVDGGLTFRDNRVTADSSILYNYWHGCSGVRYDHNTFARGTNPALDFVGTYFNNRDPVSVIIQDTEFLDGVDAGLVEMTPIGYGGWVGSGEYRVDWTVRLTVVGGGGSALSGAHVTVRDALGETVFSGTTDGAGIVQTVLSQLRIWNTADVAMNREDYTPHTVTVDTDGATATTDLLVDRALDETITFTP